LLQVDEQEFALPHCGEFFKDVVLPVGADVQQRRCVLLVSHAFLQPTLRQVSTIVWMQQAIVVANANSTKTGPTATCPPSPFLSVSYVQEQHSVAAMPLRVTMLCFGVTAQRLPSVRI